MEFSFDAGTSELILPVTPASFSVTKGSQNTIINVLDIGEINLISKTKSGKLTTISFSSFFPKQVGSYCQFKYFSTPYECVERIEGWVNEGSILNFKITDTSINPLTVTVENFVYGEKDGSGDVYYTLELKEYRALKTEAAATSTATGAANNKASAARPVQLPTRYVVKSGDNLTKIAAKYGTTVDSLVAKNNIPNRDLIYVGQVLTI